jgi:hypothetical protein
MDCEPEASGDWQTAEGRENPSAACSLVAPHLHMWIRRVVTLPGAAGFRDGETRGSVARLVKAGK